MFSLRKRHDNGICLSAVRAKSTAFSLHWCVLDRFIRVLLLCSTFRYQSSAKPVSFLFPIWASQPSASAAALLALVKLIFVEAVIFASPRRSKNSLLFCLSFCDKSSVDGTSSQAFKEQNEIFLSPLPRWESHLAPAPKRQC